MNPILLGRHVEQGLRELVHSTLNTTSSGFEGAVERFLENPNHFMKGPWVTVDLPFKNIEDADGNWTQPFPEIPLKFAPYIHQAKAFERLTAQKPQSTLVATGTGSGKTESYLWPILDYCRQHADQPGIKAILIYPMNALATDQARRVASAITNNPALKGVRAGIYADAEPRHASDVVTADSLITRRETMRQNPPDILLTNYKMLDYLLLRGDDLPLWSNNGPETLQFLVVDEMHTFDGAQGSDLALLIRRLKHRLSMPKDHLVCVGSSATLGSGDEAVKDLVDYAETIFGEKFRGDAVVRETRVTAGDLLQHPEYFDTPETSSVVDVLTKAEGTSQSEAARLFTECLFDDQTDPDLAVFYNELPTAPAYRLHLGKLLKEHWIVQRLIETIDRHSGPINLEDLSVSLLRAKPLRRWTEPEARALAEVIVSLISWARSGHESALRPLFNLRIQVWIREMARMVASLPRIVNGELIPSTLHHADDLDLLELDQMLPVVNCQRCGSTAHIGRENPTSNSYFAPLDTVYSEFFDGSSAGNLRLFYTDKLAIRGNRAAYQIVFPGLLDPSTLEFTPDERQLDTENGRIPVWMYTPAIDGRVDRTCPACGYAQGLVLFGVRATRMTAAVSSILFTSEQNEEQASDKPRFLLFSDSVQDAAQRGAVTEVRNAQSVIQKALYQSIVEHAGGYVSVHSLVDELPQNLHNSLGPDEFSALFIPRDLTWKKSYQELVSVNKAVEDRALLRAIGERLSWSIFEHLTFKSHMLTSLEGHSIAIADVETIQLAETTSRFAKQLANASKEFSDINLNELTQFIFGVIQRLRRQGSVAHPYLVKAIEKSRPLGQLNGYAAGAAMGLKGVMPSLRPSSGLVPRPVSQRGGLAQFENIHRDGLTNWFVDWVYRALFRDELSFLKPREIYQLLFERLLSDGWLLAVSRENDDDERPRGYLVDPNTIKVTIDAAEFECDYCKRKEISLSGNVSQLEGMRCTRLACSGSLKSVEKSSKRALLRALTSDRTHRVVAREHTGLLDTDTRLSIEKGFIESETKWAPNLISATPTLEMGIDIGDLSTMLLCSVPPEEANYVQRMGRTGRRDGNALNFVLANARSHDLQFWENPNPMLKGEVSAPGVYIAAEAVLIRQITAFTLDSYVAQSSIKGDFGKVSEVRKRREAGHTSGFPMDWLTFTTTEGEALAKAFIELLPVDVQAESGLMDRLTRFVTADETQSMRWSVLQAFDDADIERAKLVDKREELTKEKRKLASKQAEFTPDEYDKLVERIEQDRKEINRLIRNGIDDVPVIKFLTDRGRLPNYAFPEEGVKLTSLLSRRDENSSVEDNIFSIEYMRSASSALSEFALGQTFYANGRQVQISRLDMSSEDLTRWRFCPTCSHVENTTVTDDLEACPRCGDDMWSDVGSIHDVVELKSVLAISSEEKASIRDTDQRSQIQFDRTMVPHYEDEDISAAWISGDENVSAPFGYELVNRCTFRDFNFGKRADGPVGPRIAGISRSSNPFRICKHCGTHQSSFLAADEVGEHPPSCSVIKSGETDQDDWLSESFLMRSFETEAIRVIIPVVGEVNYDEIKSFVAAVNLGMRKYFAGKVDHIRSAVVESQINGLSTVRSLFLYDAVPGGSGYLRQLADNPSAMKAVVQNAFQALDQCPCAQEDKTGCYRCVKSYRSQFGPGEPDRDLARAMMERVLDQWDTLSRSASALDTELSNSLIRSELESLFISSLSKLDGWSLTPQVVGDGTRGFVLSTDTGRMWAIEPQVQIKNRFKNMPTKVVDFLITPIDVNVAKPIVIETDGIRYHAASITKDIQDRIEMIRSGEVSVWSLSWYDLQEKAKRSFSNPLEPSCFTHETNASLARVLSYFEKKGEDYKSQILEIQQKGSFELLVETLRDEIHHEPATGVLLRAIVGNGSDTEKLEDLKNLRSENYDWLLQRQFVQSTNSGGLSLVLAVDKVQPTDFKYIFEDIHALLRFNLPPVHHESEITEEFIASFRGFWRAINVLQFLPMLHLEFPDLDTLDLPKISNPGPSTSEIDLAWAKVRAEVLEEYWPLVDTLIAAEVSVPDSIGEELTNGNRIIGCTELGWSEQNVWVTDDDTLSQENLIFWDLTTAKIPEVVAEIITRLERVKGNNS
jgi:DEAD/DEAH box helicase domain-containing protein